MRTHDYLQRYLQLGLTPVPLKLRSGQPLVKWRNGWNPAHAELRLRASKPGINWGVSCGGQVLAWTLMAQATKRLPSTTLFPLQHW